MLLYNLTPCGIFSLPTLQDPIRLFEGNAILRRLLRIGVLDQDHMKLDYVLGLKVRREYSARRGHWPLTLPSFLGRGLP